VTVEHLRAFRVVEDIGLLEAVESLSRELVGLGERLHVPGRELVLVRKRLDVPGGRGRIGLEVVVEVEVEALLHFVGGLAELTQRLPDRLPDLGEAFWPDHHEGDDEDDHEFQGTDVEHGYWRAPPALETSLPPALPRSRRWEAALEPGQPASIPFPEGACSQRGVRKSWM
jgi:hypothetical protein